MICAPIIASSVNEAIKDMKRASAADLIELRMDFIRNPSIKRLLAGRRKPVIVTVRKRSEGGRLKIEDKKRIELFKQAIDSGVEYIDVELSSKKIINHLKEHIKKNKKKTKLIISWHDFKGTNKKDINEKYNEIKKIKNADVIKIVSFANDINDNLIIFDLIKRAKKEGKKIIGLCMGEKGEISRILGPIFGSFLTFGSLEKGKESAPGQISVEVMKNVYRINELKGKNAKVFGLVGNPISESKGYLIHNKAFSGTNRIYVNFLVDDIRKFMGGFDKMISGLSVTMPFKQPIMKELDKIDGIAKKIKAVNTVVVKGEKLVGYNTDYIGALNALKKETEIKGKNVLMLGAGGVARALACGIVDSKGKLVICDIVESKARNLANDFGCNHCKIADIEKLRINILINATPVGMYPRVNASPIDKKLLKRGMVVFDVVYNPLETKLIKDAKSKGCKVVSGVEMFVGQAVGQFKMWTNKKAPAALMKKIVVAGLK